MVQTKAKNENEKTKESTKESMEKSMNEKTKESTKESTKEIQKKERNTRIVSWWEWLGDIQTGGHVPMCTNWEVSFICYPLYFHTTHPFASQDYFGCQWHKRKSLQMNPTTAHSDKLWYVVDKTWGLSYLLHLVLLTACCLSYSHAHMPFWVGWATGC